MAKFRVEGKVQVAVSIVVEAENAGDAMIEADQLWQGLNDFHTGKAVGIFDDDDLDPRICEDGSVPEWSEVEYIG
jgi:hypothetical protein